MLGVLPATGQKRMGGSRKQPTSLQRPESQPSKSRIFGIRSQAVHAKLLNHTFESLSFLFFLSVLLQVRRISLHLFNILAFESSVFCGEEFFV